VQFRSALTRRVEPTVEPNCVCSTRLWLPCHVEHIPWVRRQLESSVHVHSKPVCRLDLRAEMQMHRGSRLCWKYG